MDARKKSYLAGALLVLSAASLIVALSDGVLTPRGGLAPDSPVTIRANTPQ